MRIRNRMTGLSSQWAHSQRLQLTGILFGGAVVGSLSIYPSRPVFRPNLSPGTPTKKLISPARRRPLK
jgi:hypothetical protein